MQTEKTYIEIADVEHFLNNYYGDIISNTKELKGGKHSQAYSFIHQNKSHVIRFNESNLGFTKDKFAYDHFSSSEVITPKVFATNTYKDQIFYCITEFVSGETARDQYVREDYSSLPVQFKMIDIIANIKLETLSEISELNFNKVSNSKYIKSIYGGNEMFDWENIFKIPSVDKEFTDYLADKIESFAKYVTVEPEIIHGDFGNDNVFIKNGQINGIIDWEKTRYADRFLDVGRVVFYCPNREITTKTALEHYKHLDLPNWEERLALGVYHIVLTNYAHAALSNNQTSCSTSKARLNEIQNILRVS